MSSEPCHECGGEKQHRKNCPLRLIAKAQRLVDDPVFYQKYLTLRIASHMIKLDEMASAGSVPAAKQFRDGALDILELMDAAAEKEAGRTGAGIPRSGDGTDRPEEPEGSAS